MVGRTADAGEDAARRERDAAAATIEPRVRDGMSEADAVLDLFGLPRQFDMGERVGCEVSERRRRNGLGRWVCAFGDDGAARSHDCVRAQRDRAPASAPKPGTGLAGWTTPLPGSDVDWRRPVSAHACKSSAA